MAKNDRPKLCRPYRQVHYWRTKHSIAGDKKIEYLEKSIPRSFSLRWGLVRREITYSFEESEGSMLSI